MPFVSLLVLLLASGAPVVSAPPEVPSQDHARTSVWAASGVVGTDGALRLLPGWRVRLGLGGRAHLIGPTSRAPRARGPWDDEATVGAAHIAVRVTARDAGAVYVEGRLRHDAHARSFLLRWDAASGAWSEPS